MGDGEWLAAERGLAANEPAPAEEDEEEDDGGCGNAPGCFGTNSIQRAWDIRLPGSLQELDRHCHHPLRIHI
jgi:hypothetical protein